MTTVFCWKCGAKSEFSGKVGFREDCESCGADSHACKNCEFYDVKVYNECKEPAADRITEKERNNYCEYFQPKGSSPGTGDKKADLLSAAEALFKKK